MSEIMRAFYEGGAGMWPTFFLGTAALALALRHATRPRPELVPLVVGLGAATLLAGALGTVTGLVASTRYIGELPVAERIPVMMVGLGESLNNVALALLLTAMMAIAAALGSYRLRRGADSAEKRSAIEAMGAG